ncbi:IMV membrane protein [Eastern grey kangaroopox virus]|uniref:IMV membrane protein n=1 Tax=Eastern grey kangaroopox virus TaxID=2042482 RepID=A0A2C9DT86_9POXV|nr:IMV membrane protein [Eastern grey kangaroopox virus]ATI21219.1 IMV membrane protein [Eastern grey kangaroopox virus]ATX75125.1 IMV membrane protein [Eastern grey kangaroopox virus]
MSYLNYYNIFDQFDAGAGVLEDELFTHDEKLSFLPAEHGGQNDRVYNGIMRNGDVRLLISLIMLVLAINTSSILSIVFLCVSAILSPMPAVVIAYCVAVQIGHPQAGRHLGLAILTIIFAIVTIYLNSIMGVRRNVKAVLHLILGVMTAVYVFRISGTRAPICAKPGIFPSFSETY